jgi:hypothetical protein
VSLTNESLEPFWRAFVANIEAAIALHNGPREPARRLDVKHGADAATALRFLRVFTDGGQFSMIVMLAGDELSAQFPSMIGAWPAGEEPLPIRFVRLGWSGDTLMAKFHDNPDPIPADKLHDVLLGVFLQYLPLERRSR